MKAPEMTKELKMDLKVLKMRGSLDPKRFYKKNDRDGFPKYFQVSGVMDSIVEDNPLMTSLFCFTWRMWQNVVFK